MEKNITDSTQIFHKGWLRDVGKGWDPGDELEGCSEQSMR